MLGTRMISSLPPTDAPGTAPKIRKSPESANSAESDSDFARAYSPQKRTEPAPGRSQKVSTPQKKATEKPDNQSDNQDQTEDASDSDLAVAPETQPPDFFMAESSVASPVLNEAEKTGLTKVAIGKMAADSAGAQKKPTQTNGRADGQTTTFLTGEVPGIGAPSETGGVQPKPACDMEHAAPVPSDSPVNSVAVATLLEAKTKATLHANTETPDDQAALSALSRHSEVEGAISKREFAGPPVTIAQQRAVVVQVAQAVNGAEGSVEISLDPAELGKVRLTLRASETGMNVQVVAERPHTIDLLRRNIGQLEAEFRELGFSDIGFDFSQQNNGSASSDQPHGEDWWMETPDVSTAPIINAIPARRVANGGSGLDLRL